MIPLVFQSKQRISRENVTMKATTGIEPVERACRSYIFDSAVLQEKTRV